MRSPSAILGGLLLAGGVSATLADLEGRDACNEDNLYRCFLASTSLASQYCSQSITLPGPTGTATVTPTATVTSTITITNGPRPSGKFNRAKKAKRGENCKRNTTRTVLGCFNGQPGTVAFAASRLTSACSCIGITSHTYSATVTDTTATITELTTQTISSCPTNTVFLTETETETETATVTQITSSPYDVTTTTTSVSTVTEIQIETTTEVKTETTTDSQTDTTTEVQTATKTEVSTQISSVTITEIQTETQTTTATTVSTTIASASAPACPESVAIIQNGNFESGNLDHWQATAVGGIATTSNAEGGSGGSARALLIQAPYPVFSVTSGYEYTNKFNCVAGASYRISVDTMISTAQASGNPWSVKVQGVVFASGAGSTVNPAVWNTYSTTFVCSATEADRKVVLSAVSNYLRGGSFKFDNIFVLPLTLAN